MSFLKNILGLATTKPLSIMAFSFADELRKLNPFADDVNIYDVIGNVLVTATTLSGLIAIAFAIIGGYKYIASAGNPEEAKKATSTITWSVIGLILIIAAGMIVGYILDTVRRGG